jgi:signal transduction histidine kinase
MMAAMHGGHDSQDERLQRYASLQAALDLIDQGFSLIDDGLRLVAWNRAFIELLEFPPAMVHAGAPFESFIRYNALRGDYGPGDPEAQVAERVAAARALTAHDFERTRPGGQVLRVRGVPVPGVGFITLYSDITAHKRAEQRVLQQTLELEERVAERTRELLRSEQQMRLVTDSIPALIAYFDQHKRYRYINRGYQEWFGLDPAHPERVSARAYLGDATYASIRPNVALALAGQAVSYEYEALTVGELLRTAHTTLIPERSPQGEVVGCFELTFDVSELRRAQERLAHADKMEALGQLTGGIAHDFNNMLTVIMGNLGALRESSIGPAAAGFVDPALSAARRGAELIRTLLGFSRSEPLAPQATEIGPLAALVVKLLRRSLPPSTLLQLDAPAEPLWAWVDASHLQDALVNLILNARDAQAGAITVRVRAAHLDAIAAKALQATPGPQVQLDVVDDGHGMDAATQARVFEPFFTTKRTGAGSGLGMSMVYGFVRQSQGGIRIASAPGRGTTISLWLPVADAAGPEPATPVVPAPSQGRAQWLVLLVEDEAEVRHVVRRHLLDLGHAVIEAEDGDEALQILDAAEGIALVLSDIVMPGRVDGRGVARHALARKLPRVALMSAHAPQQGEPLPDVPLLPKPFDKAALAAFLERHFDA